MFYFQLSFLNVPELVLSNIYKSNSCKKILKFSFPEFTRSARNSLFFKRDGDMRSIKKKDGTAFFGKITSTAGEYIVLLKMLLLQNYLQK